MTDPAQRRLHRLPVTLAGLALILLLARSWTAWPSVYHESGQVRLLGVTPYYHLRHAGYVAKHFPHLQRWDIATGYPQGQRAESVGLFDLAVGTAAWVIGLGDPSDRLVVQAAAWAPVILMLAMMVSLYALAATVMGQWAALITAALLLLYPGQLREQSTLGVAGYHVAEALLVLLTLVGIVKLIQATDDDAPSRPWWRPALAAALPMALLQFISPAAPVYLIVTGVTLLLIVTAQITRGSLDVTLATAMFRYGSALLIIVAVVGLLCRDLVMAPDVLPLILLGCGLLAVIVPLYALIARALLARGAAPLGIALTSLVVFAAAAVLIFVLSPQARQMGQRLPGIEAVLAGESPRVTWQGFQLMYALPGYLALTTIALGALTALGAVVLTVPVGIIQLIRKFRWDLSPIHLTADQLKVVHAASIRFEGFVPLIFGALLMALWWRSGAYGAVVPPFVALTATMALIWLGEHVAFWHRLARPIMAVAVALLVTLQPLMSRQTISPWVSKASAASMVSLDDVWTDALQWLKANAPSPSVPIDQPVKPWGDQLGGYQYPNGDYGVLSAWEYGHLVAGIAQRPAVQSQRAGMHTARWLIETDEQASLGRLRAGCQGSERVRYIILDAGMLANRFESTVRTAQRSPADYRELYETIEAEGDSLRLYTFGPKYRQSMAGRMYLDDGEGLTRYRLIYESTGQSFLTYRLRGVFYRRRPVLVTTREAFAIKSPEDMAKYEEISKKRTAEIAGGFLYGGEIHSTIKIFEQVPGAKVTGKAAPGQQVHARITMRVATTQRQFEFHNQVQADAEGWFTHTIPYHTVADDDDAVQALSPCRFSVMRSEQEVHLGQLDITQEQVQRGKHMALQSSP